MGFWIYMLFMDLLLPFIMIGFGRNCMKKTPNEINTVFGYRTPMSTKNKDTWEFAHKYFGKIWYISGLITLPTSIILMFFVIGKGTELVGTAGAIIMGVQLVPMLGSIFPTEIALRKNFDKNGERK